MPLTLRLRHPKGTTTLAGLPESMTLSDFRDMVAEEAGISLTQLELRIGVPTSRSLDGAESRTLSEAGIGDRDVVIATLRPRQEATVAGEGACEREVEEGAALSGKSGGRKRALPAVHEPRASDLLPALDRAIAAATKQVAISGQDKHQIFALRKAKAAVVESLKSGNNISLGALHTLTGVGHWVVDQVKRQMETCADVEDAPGKKFKAAPASSRAAPAPTPESFTWHYLGRNGKKVTDRNSAEFQGPLGNEMYRVCITHSSGRVEKAWLPEVKAPPRCS